MPRPSSRFLLAAALALVACGPTAIYRPQEEDLLAKDVDATESASEPPSEPPSDPAEISEDAPPPLPDGCHDDAGAPSPDASGSAACL